MGRMATTFDGRFCVTAGSMEFTVTDRTIQVLTPPCCRRLAPQRTWSAAESFSLLFYGPSAGRIVIQEIPFCNVELMLCRTKTLFYTHHYLQSHEILRGDYRLFLVHVPV